MSRPDEPKAEAIDFSRALICVRMREAELDRLREALERAGFVFVRADGTRGERIIAVSPQGVVFWAYKERREERKEAEEK